MIENVIPFNAIPILAQKTSFSLKHDEKEFVMALKYNTSDSGTKISEDIYVLNDPKMNRIKDYFLQAVNKYKKEVLQIKNNLVMTSSWSTINEFNCYHHNHTHHNSFLSLVYYVECESGLLNLNVPRSSLEQGFNFKYDVENNNLYNTREISLAVQTGSLVIFPSWLGHGTKPNQSQNKRIAIAADFFVEGDFGSIKGNDPLTLKAE